MDCPESRATLKLSEGRHWIGSDFLGDVFPSCPEVGLGAITTAPVNVPTAGQKRVVVVGASGMVGGYALRYALDSPAVKSVTSIGRKKLGISEPKLKEVVHQDFANCSSLERLVFVLEREWC